MTAKSIKSSKTYRELAAELDETLLKLQDSELDVDEATKSYEAGLKLIAQLEDHLQKAENEIQTIRAQSEKSTED